MSNQLGLSESQHGRCVPHSKTPPGRARFSSPAILETSGPACACAHRHQNQQSTGKRGLKTSTSNQNCWKCREDISSTNEKENAEVRKVKSAKSKECKESKQVVPPKPRSSQSNRSAIVIPRQKLHRPPVSLSPQPSSPSSSSSALSSSSSSSSSWLDLEFAAYVLKPRCEKRPKWAQTLLENFRRSLDLQACSGGEGEEEEDFRNSPFLSRDKRPSLVAEQVQIYQNGGMISSFEDLE